MFKGGGCDQAINIAQCYSLALRLRGNNGPAAAGDSQGNGKQARFKCGYQIVLPVFQLDPSLAGRQEFDPSTDLAKG